MKKNKYRKIKNIFNIFVLICILCFSVSVSAEMFSAGEQIAADSFGAGETVTVPEQSGTDIFGTDADLEVSIPSDAETSVPSDDSVSDEIIVEMEGTAALPGTTVTVVFKDQTDKVYTELQMSVSMGNTITLPVVPGRENAAGSGWKTTLDIVDSEAVVLESGSMLTVSDTNFDLTDKIVDNVLTLYAVPGTDPCIVTYYTNNGGQVLEQKEVKAGSAVILPDFAESGYKNLGWALQANASAAAYQIGSTCTIEQDTNFFLVRTELVDAVFYSKNGKTNAFYRNLGKTVEKGTTIIMPALQETLGYEAIGWSLTKGSTKADYLAGQTVTLKADTKFYAAYKYVGKCTVKFNNNSGTSSSKSYTSLNCTVTKNSYITLPELPKASGYINLGWTTVKKGSTVVYKAGAKIKVTKSLKLYTVRQKSYNVYLYTKNGKLWKTVEVGKNSYLKLPGVQNKNGYTMLGWSTKKGQSTKPTYEVGQSIKITKSIKLYSVLFVRSKEKDNSALELDKASSKLLTNYKQIIFVGDSRTVRMEKTLKLCGYSPSSYNISFIAETGKGLSWFKSTGYSQLLSKVGNSTSKLSKPTAVIFNLGVNDLSNLSAYVSYMKSIAPELKKRGCELYYMSVNPVNNVLINYYGKKNRPEEDIRSFNATIKSKLCNKTVGFTYINTYSYLIKYGYGTNANSEGYDVAKDDGLHYTSKTTKRIFRYCINILNQ